jgi:hypothetical protein
MRVCEEDQAAPERCALLAFVLAAVVGEVTTVVLLWDFGLSVALSGMPLGGGILGVCAAGMAQRTYLGLQ